MKIKNIESIIIEEISYIQSSYVKEKGVLGAIGAIEVEDKKMFSWISTICL